MARCTKCGDIMRESSSDDKFFYKCVNCNVTYGGYVKELGIISCNKRLFEQGSDICVSCDWNDTCIVQKEKEHTDRCSSYKHEKEEKGVDG